ncbi:MAG: 16S rRNA (uracil(1498)-N(3))-methyltransferase [Gammaproteobacteria bacterium]|nr:16S rRNA (uracil(1498)-N(3))-methyltransferase [Gammaproteobacteria bacterium]MCW5582321.1 16S rRNA (uracil(1498)-N(3))-methyltransferase [Gammaproteobacteria bacterium]
MSRIYQSVPLGLHCKINLDDKASHHLARVLRARMGDEMTLFNGLGGEYVAVITHIGKKNVEVETIEFRPRELEPPIKIHLAQGLTHGEKMDFIIQKAVELGAANITPVVTERCNVRLDQRREEKRLQHWQAIVISACEQSGRNRLPTVAAPVALKEWLSYIKADFCFVLSPHIKNKLPAVKLPEKATVALLIGPEGGLSEREVVEAVQQGFVPLNLGPRILRTETATIAVLTALQLYYGDFS